MRGVFVIEPGAVVGCRSNNQAFIVKAWLDSETVIAENLITGFASNLSIYDLMPRERSKSKVGDLFDLSEKQRLLAKERFRAIEPLIQRNSRAAVESRSKELDVSPATLYRWLKSYRESGVVSSLVRTSRSDKGEKKLSDQQEKLVKLAIDEYLTQERLPITEAYQFLKAECRKAKVKPPHLSTLRQRIADVDEVIKANRRMGRRAAFDQFAPKTRHFPGADYPYAVLQIDHKRLDTVIVDESNRVAIDRPWITVAIDVYSRIIAGYYLSLDSPSSLSVSMCLAMSILPKDNVLAQVGVEGKWPCFGIPTKVHVDNAKEFRAEALTYGANEYGFEIAYRKVKRPEYGGHIESLLGNTFTSGLSTIPGRTFSNTVERGDYDSAAKSVITLRELDKWMLDFVVNTYHNRPHSETLMPPVHRYTIGLLGSDEQPGPGRVLVPVSGQRLLLDFLQIHRRPVHRSGIIIDRIWYYDEVLNRWINSRDPEHSKQKRKFIIRRDPRDISHIWFYDPEIKEYHRISYRNLARPSMSLWEYRAVRKWMEEQGINATDEDAIFRSFERRREIVASAKAKTRKARREGQRRKLHQVPLDSHTAVANRASEKFVESEKDETVGEGVINVDPFDEIEIY